MERSEVAMIVTVTGSRRLVVHSVVCNELEIIHREDLIDLLVEGAAGGADSIAHDWAKRRLIATARFPVNHDRDGKWPAAGPRRNGRMLHTIRPHLLLAFPDSESKGTWDCVRQAKALGIEVRVFEC